MMIIKRLWNYLVALVILGCSYHPAAAQVQTWPRIFIKVCASGLVQPVALTHAGDGRGRLFIVEQAGVIKIFNKGILGPSPFLNISSKVLLSAEQGLLGLAFPPNYSAKNHFYVYYTSLTGDNVVARYTLSADPDVADPTSEQIILTMPHPTYANHNGGQLAFSPRDGYLYIGTGDGGGGGDPFNNAQNPQSLLGKILRLDVESAPDPGFNYKIPNSNPFFDVTGYRPEIWALGLRNPWRFSFDRLTPDLYIGDVGQAGFEEVDFQPATSPGGENYGWNILEGPACYNPPTNCLPPPGYVPPVIYYDHTEGIAILGGYVYRGARYGSLKGIYFFGDLTGKIWGLRRNSGGLWQRSLLLSPGFSISSFGEDEKGNLYVIDYGLGQVYEIIGSTVNQGELELLLLD
jgi:glucose/arabinose dehydrogenase